MLRVLSIRNFVVVDALDVEFEHGLTVLTGETGAGKSILLDALSLLLGDRFELRQLRPGAARAGQTSGAGGASSGPGPRERCSQATSSHRPCFQPTRRYTAAGTKPSARCSDSLCSFGSATPANTRR